MNEEPIIHVNFSKWDEDHPPEFPEEVLQGSYIRYKEYIKEINKDPSKRHRPKQIVDRKCCDNCIYYMWHTHWCERFMCDVDPRSVCSQHSNTKIFI